MKSVCMATYNGGRFLEQQIDSILCQLDGNDELVISDDSSTDRTVEIVRDYRDPRIRLFTDQTFRSAISNFEHAIAQSRGDVLFLADQDDVWETDKVAMMTAALERADMVVCDCSVVDEDLNVLVPSYFKRYGSRPGFLKNFLKNGYIGSCMAFDLRMKSLALPFPKGIPMHDIWLGAVAEITGCPVFLRKVLVKHRLHGGNLTATGRRSRYGLARKVKFRVDLLRALWVLLANHPARLAKTTRRS